MNKTEKSDIEIKTLLSPTLYAFCRNVQVGNIGESVYLAYTSMSSKVKYQPSYIHKQFTIQPYQINSTSLTPLLGLLSTPWQSPPFSNSSNHSSTYSYGVRSVSKLSSQFYPPHSDHRHKTHFTFFIIICIL